MLRSSGRELVCVSQCDITEQSTAVTVGSFVMLAVVFLLSVFGSPAMFALHRVMFCASLTSHLAALASVLYNPSGLRALCFTGFVIIFLDLGYCRAVLLFRNQFLLWEEGIIC